MLPLNSNRIGLNQEQSPACRQSLGEEEEKIPSTSQTNHFSYMTGSRGEGVVLLIFRRN
jgi:hypothetical protein